LENLIYYPSFIIEDEEWLRFALLYMGSVTTIVPEDADAHLSEVHQIILNETNLLTSYRPEYREMEKATRDVLSRLDKRINNPINRYRGITKGYDRPTDFEIWSTVANQNFELYRSKFSYELEIFCKEHNFSRNTDKGVLISDDIGKEYMSLLAKEIANDKNLHVITDLNDHRSRNTILESPPTMKRRMEEFNAINGFMKMNIPNGLKEIPLNEIIQLRNSSSYQKKLFEFQLAVDRLINNHDYQITERTMYDIHYNIQESKNGLIGELSSFGTALIGTTIGISCSLNDSLPLEVFREVLGTGTVFSSFMPLYKRYGNRRERRLAASFVTDLKQLNRNRVPNLI